MSQGYFIHHSFRFLLILLCVLRGRQSPLFGRFSCFINSWFGHLVESSWRVFISTSKRGLCVSFFRRDSRLRVYHLFVRSHFTFLHNSQWITFFTQSYLLLYIFGANLLHSPILWFIVSSLSTPNQHLLFWCVLSNFALMEFVFMALSCATKWSDPVSLLRFPFPGHVFSFKISLVCRLNNSYSCSSFHLSFLVIFYLLIFIVCVVSVRCT